MNREVKQIEFKDEFKDCPECGYKDGFHNIFKKDNAKKLSEGTRGADKIFSTLAHFSSL